LFNTVEFGELNDFVHPIKKRVIFDQSRHSKPSGRKDTSSERRIFSGEHRFHEIADPAIFDQGVVKQH